MSKQWTPVPQSLEYDLVTHAIYHGEIPADYAICQLVPASPDDAGDVPVVAMTPAQIDALNTLAYGITFGNDYPEERDAQQIIQAMLTELEGKR